MFYLFIFEMPINQNTLSEALQQKFSTTFAQEDDTASNSKNGNAAQVSDLPTLILNRENLIEVLRYLKTHPEFQFNFLTDICGVHYPDNKPDKEFAVVYHLHSWPNNFRLRIKVYCSRKDTRVPSAVPVFPAANWMERETYDFFGIQFTDHPNLKRILNIDEMDFFPLRKEYPLEEQTRTDKNDKMFGR